MANISKIDVRHAMSGCSGPCTFSQISIEPDLQHLSVDHSHLSTQQKQILVSFMSEQANKPEFLCEVCEEEEEEEEFMQNRTRARRDS